MLVVACVFDFFWVTQIYKYEPVCKGVCVGAYVEDEVEDRFF